MATAMKYSVVFIDDDEDDLEMLEESVTSIFPTVECLRFSSPVSAIKYLCSPLVSPLCIFVDINMPVMCGDEVLQKIKVYDHLNESTIAILSTCITEDTRKTLMAHGANYTIVKPSTFAEFRDRVCAVIKRQLNRVQAL
jgi:response regulator RpfG family c-di-GMP phosphodiesterase